MTLDPRTPLPVSFEGLRERARRHGEALGMPTLIAIAAVAAVLAISALAMLDYMMGQQSHRLIKLLFGAIGLGAIAGLPHFGLSLFPVLLPLLGLFPKLPIPGVNTLNALVLGVFFSFALIKVMRREPFLRGGWLHLPIAAFLVFCVFSIMRAAAFPTGHTYQAAPAGMSLFRSGMSFAVYFVAIAMLRGAKDRTHLVWGVVLGLAIETAFTFAYGRNLHGRATGTIGQANELGTFLAMFSVFALSLAFGARAWWQRGFALAVAVCGSIGVFMTVSRGAMMALAAAALLVAARSSRVFFVLLVVGVATNPFWMPEYVKERLSTTQTEDDESDDVTLDAGAQSRVNTWQTLMVLIQEHPLDGVGYDALGDVLPQAGAALGLRVKDSSHNTYLRILAELGIFGMMVFLWFWWRCVRLCEAGIRVAADRFERQVAVGAGAGFLVLAISCWFGDRFWDVQVTGNLWVLCAVIDHRVQEYLGVRA
ncbi:MAG: hypothetical protein HOP12_16225 [Candidatus Eisenbacteria bacterium]|uniref:O-antigen ligase-related domain-containing protein n=1 Tax=Eiseniibacteriota bacterium TaxID=2212470 RepID=A0A849SIU5_UNCEI|nr:hypothetical protein [Candidatus Eisenbacteria bacterium]